ncbi:MAG: hypothetical protein JWR60_2395 [Polaromonas sp.]|nr:hypothetical protein [Polaromonas sp.]
MKTSFHSAPRRPAGSPFFSSGLLAALLCLPAATLAAPAAEGPRAESSQAHAFAGSQDARQLVDWVGETHDNQGRAFAIIDKKSAVLHVFNASGQMLGSSPVLLGLGVGDDSVPGIGERKMSTILPHERTTPAGRFVSEPGVNLQGEDIVWIDYEAAVSMHRVRTANKADKRLERLATATTADNRISYGCVNVPAAFYDAFVKPGFGAAPAVVYVLPETRSVMAQFDMAQGVSSASLAPTIKP